MTDCCSAPAGTSKTGRDHAAGRDVSDDERVLKRLDDDGEVIGFLIHEMSTLKEPSPIEFELSSEVPADDVANVTVREAAIRLRMSERRVRKLARDGRMRGAAKVGAE